MKTNATYREVLKWASSFLETCGREAAAAEVLLKERSGWTKTDIVMHLNDEMPSVQKRQLLKDISDHGAGIPIQHLLGYEWFYGLRFSVTHDTLIPRPETEEIVDKFLRQAPANRPLKILDIGTGTGAIAISIKKARPFDQVTATDLSAKALAVARENGRKLKADVRFLQGDLTEPVKKETFDVILSNPPYISEDEKVFMDQTVIAYEPKMALFAENNGLAVYQRLANELPAIVDPKGQIFLEIGFKQRPAVCEIFQEKFPDDLLSVEKDMSGHDRLLVIDRSKNADENG